MSQASFWMGTDLRTQPRVKRTGSTFEISVVVGVWTDFDCPPDEITVTVDARVIGPGDPAGSASAPSSEARAVPLKPDVVDQRASSSRAAPDDGSDRRDDGGDDDIDRWHKNRRYAPVRDAIVHPKQSDGGWATFAEATFGEFQAGCLVELTASVRARDVDATAKSAPVRVWTVEPPAKTAEIVGAHAPAGAHDRHCWVLFHRRDHGCEQFRIDLLTVNETGMPVTTLKLIVDGVVVDLGQNEIRTANGSSWIGVRVDPRRDSVHVTIPRQDALTEVTVLSDIGDGSPVVTPVDLTRPGERLPAALMIIAYLNQGLNDLFWQPVRKEQDDSRNTGSSTASTRRKNFAQIIYRDEDAAFSGRPGSDETGIPDGYAYMMRAQRKFGARSVWAVNAGSLLLLRHGLPPGQWREIVEAIGDQVISPALAGFGAHRAAYYRPETNRRELEENEGLLRALVHRGSDGIYFGDSRIYEASDDETRAFDQVGDLVRYLVLERSTTATWSDDSRRDERLLFAGPGPQPAASFVWRDAGTGLGMLLGEDYLRGNMMNATPSEVQLGQAPLAVRRLMMQSFASDERSPARLATCADDIEHFCGAGWFDGQKGLDFAAAYAAVLAWIADHAWVETVVPDGPDGRTVAGWFDERFQAARPLLISSSTDAVMDPEGASVRHQGERLYFDLWYKAWERFRVPWLGCTLGEISTSLEAALLDWPHRVPAHDKDLYDVAWLYFLSCTHENAWSKQPSGSRRGERDDPFRWDPEDFVVSESIQMRNAWVYLNASIWAGSDPDLRRDGEGHLISDSAAGPGAPGWLAPRVQDAHGADRWWDDHENGPFEDDGLYWDRDNLTNIILYNDELLAVLDQNGGVISHLFVRKGDRAVSVSGTCKAYQFLTIDGKEQRAADGLRVQNTVFTPNHAYVASDVVQAQPLAGSYWDQGGDKQVECWWPNNLDRYAWEPLENDVGVRFSYRPGAPEDLPSEPLQEREVTEKLERDGKQLRAGQPGIVWHQHPEFHKEIRLEGRTLTISYSGVQRDHLVANEFAIDLLDKLRGGDPQRTSGEGDVRTVESRGTAITVEAGRGARIRTRNLQDREKSLLQRVLTDVVLVGPEEGTTTTDFEYTIHVEGPDLEQV